MIWYHTNIKDAFYQDLTAELLCKSNSNLRQGRSTEETLFKPIWINFMINCASNYENTQAKIS